MAREKRMFVKEKERSTHVADLRVLYSYSCWMNDRILDAAERVTPEQFSAPTGLTPRNLHDNLVHIIDVEWSWRERVCGAPEEVWRAEIEAADVPDVPSLRARWAKESNIMRGYLDELTDDDLAEPLELGRWSSTRGDIMLHAINHGILARVEAAVLLTHYGQSPGDLDYLDFASPVS